MSSDRNDRRAGRLPRVEHAFARGIMSSANRGHNPRILAAFGFHDGERVKREGWAPETVERLEDLLDDAIAHPNEARDEAILDAIAATPLMDHRMAEAIRWHGVSPLDVFAMSHLAEDGRIQLGIDARITTGRRMTNVSRDGTDGGGRLIKEQCWIDKTWLRLGPGVRLVATTGFSVRIDGHLPETMMVAIAGRPLADIVSHEALDGMGLTITSATRLGEETELGLGGLDARPLTAR